MKVLGITGGVGSGKSEVLNFLHQQYGGVICQLDEVAKELEQKGQSCYEEIVERFGGKILDEDEELDRGRLADTVFGDALQLKQLNEIVHPKVREWVKEDISKKERMGMPLYIIEAALLPGAGYEEICQEMWYIYADEKVRRERLKASRGYTDEKISRMMQSQPSEATFRETCTVVIDNSRTFDDTKKQIGEKL